jgi:fused signal recognition particle receptor
VHTTNIIIEQLKTDIKEHKITTPEHLKVKLEALLVNTLKAPDPINLTPSVVLMVGVNGSGKTTFCAKYAYLLKKQNKRIILVAGDTFRAAATHQLLEWGEKTGVPVFVGKENQDPASVVFDACKKYKDEQFDHIIIDTAGRLQTKVNLMRELEKIKRTIEKQVPDVSIHTWLAIDAMLGQNSLRQAELFDQATKLNGLIITKLDGTGKGGIVFAIAQKMGLPVVYITYGEQLDDIALFNPTEYVHDLLYE